MKHFQKLIYSVFLLLIWTLFYEFINRVLKIKASKYGQIDTKNRVVSIMHGQISFWLCTLTLLFNPNIANHQNCHTVDIILLISMSYFTYDTIACLWYNLFDGWMLFHHITCIVIQGMGLFSDGYKESYFIILGLSVAEISNFPMHMTEILKNVGLKHTKIYQFIENSYFFLYSMARGFISPAILLIPVCMNPNLHIMVKIMISFIHVQSFHVILTSILKSVKRNRLQEEEMVQKNIEYNWFQVDTQKISILSFFEKEGEKKDQ